MMSDPTIRAYFEANKCLMTVAKDMPIGVSLALLGAAIWGRDRHDINDPLTLEDLAARIGVSPTTISQHLRYLSYGYREGTPGLGLVETAENADNRRKKIFYLTSKGKGLVSQLQFVFSKAT
ncbi:ArsR family transcriptional regulator [Mesorhizobium sp. PAMC28654]|uniref:ArsR family transcriptional regulator n=1 Tax=Mesorhizobium sp. PAMC28654 TaxID=2880934 RepID=UPI001D0A158B|nr:ArsR family transcriptional regulator [Mesorhizobium sp. PAMC28654]UDL87658.1 ArsR family transcriptional regulator [Mesorhizobium sp. PAMC28654]